VHRYSLAYRLFSGVCLTLIAVGWLVGGLNETNPWEIGVGVFVLLGAIGDFFTAYRHLQRRATHS
jgi:F0F1-type ATP synthase assembly protein I